MECIADWCSCIAKTKGMCIKHYTRFLHYWDMYYKKERIRWLCTIEWCNNPHNAHWYCSKHYARLRIHWDPNIFLPNYRTKCSIEWCGKKHNSKWYCKKHLRAYELYWDPLFIKIRIWENRKDNPLYKWYSSMIARCYNKNNKNFKNYWWRWISICSEWLWMDWFSTFIRDMWERPEGCTLDRIDVNGNYCKQNCRWSDMFTQSNNKRSKHKVWVYYDKRYNRYIARITHNKKLHYLWYHNTYEDAVVAREKYEHEHNLSIH